jgi:nitroreductase
MICPVGAVRVDGRSLPEYPGNAEAFFRNEKTAEITEHLIQSKRSVRSYNDKPLGELDLNAIMRAGELSPTASNSRQVKAILLKGEEVRDSAAFIARILLPLVRVAGSPFGRALFRVLGAGRYAKKRTIRPFQAALERTVEGLDDVLFFKAPAIVILSYPAGGKRFGRTDCALAGQNMMLTAHSRNIGSCMIGFAEAALWNRRLRKKIGVPAHLRIGLIFTLGYTDNRYYRYPVREEWQWQNRKRQNG